MPKRKHSETVITHAYFTRYRKAKVIDHFRKTGNDALPTIASALETKALNNFTLANRLFYQSANRHFRSEIFKHIACTSEIELTQDVVRIINQLRFPRQVLKLLGLSPVMHRSTYPCESDLITDYNNPACWYLLDDNLSLFLQTFSNPIDSRIYLPLAILYSRFRISKYLMQYAKDFNYQQMASLQELAVAGGDFEIYKIVNFTDKNNIMGKKLSVNHLVFLAVA